MKYQAIARKWRPQRFEEVVGQEAITKTLQNAVRFERVHPAYIFSGPRGVGKTTLARILAKALNCKKTDRPNPTPCAIDENACISCLEIAESRSIDVLEFDAASNTQVEKVRDIIIEKVDTVPARDRYKIFIIDEVHMLSTSSFNALLKTLEEPPAQVLFLMATTELQRVPATILSRCQKFQFQTIPTEKIFDKLREIAKVEKISIQEQALWEIARSGEGSMRDALTAFDQVISFTYAQAEGALTKPIVVEDVMNALGSFGSLEEMLTQRKTIRVEDVMNALGRASSEILRRTIDAISTQSPTDIISIVGEISRKGQNLATFCQDLMQLIRNLLVAKLENPEKLLENTAFSTAELQSLASKFTEKELIRLFHALSDIQFRLRQAKEPRYQLEIGLIKLIEIKRLTPIEDILERLQKLESKLNTLSQIPEDPSETKKKSEDKLIQSQLRISVTEEFEHIDIASIDSELEELLVFHGETLLPIKNVNSIINSLELSDSLQKTSIEELKEKQARKLKPPKDATEDEIKDWITQHPITQLLKERLKARLLEIKTKNKSY
jgi:DNA polymerase-3 subunit gamma/tau